MSTGEQLVHARVVLTLSVVKRGQTVYLKIPKDLNAGLGLIAGDNAQIAYMGKLYPAAKNE